MNEQNRCRVIVSTDIGGSDPDDFQSMVHYLLYSDQFDTEGLISSPFGDGRKSDILAVIDRYEQDYPNLKTASANYPAPDALRAVTMQGALSFAPYRGWSVPTEGSEHIIRCARRDDPRPLYLLMWGLLEDLAQALHDAPDIAGKLRVHYIGGPNKKWGPNAYAYIRREFPELWMIENNSTYRGWFNGGNMNDPFGNESFVSAYAKGHGALGDYFATHLGGCIKMGDTPTVAWLLHGNPTDPEGDSWGGRFERVRNMPEHALNYPTSLADEVEAFSVAEITFHGPVIPPTDAPVFEVEIQGQRFEGYYTGAGCYQFRFTPKEAGNFVYTLHSEVSELEGLTGEIRAVWEKPETRRRGPLTSWWSDLMDPAFAEGPHKGAKTVNQWRRDFLEDFAVHFARCLPQKG